MGLALNYTNNSDLLSIETTSTGMRYFSSYIDNKGILWLEFKIFEEAWEVTPPALVALNRFIQTVDQTKVKAIILHFTSATDLPEATADINPQAKVATLNHTNPTTNPYSGKQLEEHFHQGEKFYTNLQNLRIPSLTFLDSSCYGSTLLIALATQKQIATADKSIKLGFPEAHLGLPLNTSTIYPLINKLGAYKALELLLSGQSLTAQEALDTHIIDKLATGDTLCTEIHNAINTPKALSQTLRAKPTYVSDNLNLITREALFNLSFMRSAAALFIKRRHAHALSESASSLITAWRAYAKNPDNLHQTLSKAFIQQHNNPAVDYLRHNYLLANQLKSQARRHIGHSAHTAIRKVYIAGYTTQSIDLALQCVAQQLQVTLQHKPSDQTERLLKHLDTSPDRDLLQKNLTQVTQMDIASVQEADVIIQMAADDLLSGQQVLYQLEKHAKPSALLGCSLHTGSVELLGSHLSRPEKLLGLHFFNQVQDYPLLEIIQTDQSEKTSISESEGKKKSEKNSQISPEKQRAYAFAAHIQAIPFTITDAPGHLVYRVAMAYIRQGIRLYHQDVPLSLIDQAGHALGMKYGPLEMADHIGLDICKQLMEVMEKLDYSPPPPVLAEKLKAGCFGKRSGTGFYHYRKGRRLKYHQEPEKWVGNCTLLKTKLLHEIHEEAGLCLEQGIVDDPKLLDLGVVFGVGFPASLGGPLSHLQSTDRKYS